MTREDTVAEFHKAMSHPINADWTTKLLDFRMTLIQEEVMELSDEVVNCAVKIDTEEQVFLSDKAALLKEMADIQYVLSGMAVALGLPLQEAFERVHKSNMSKLGEDGLPILREDGKILKGENYIPPTFWDLIE